MTKLTIEGLRRERERGKARMSLRESVSAGTRDKAAARRIELMTCCGTGCIAGGAFRVMEAMASEIARHRLQNEVSLVTTGCNGFCGQGPLLVVMPEGVFYGWLTPKDVPTLVEEHLVKGRPVERLMFVSPETNTRIPLVSDIPFFSKQKLVVLRNKGIIDPEKVEDYIARDGYAALAKALSAMTPDQVIEEIARSGLRGRGGAGFPTGTKWAVCRKEPRAPKYIIGNCDEGDPGAYMDRSLLESDPHALVEGMAIAAYAIGAARGYVYMRTEYPLAIARLRTALAQAGELGLLGHHILGSDFSFEVEIREGSGAFVCGEETSLIHSIEGRNPEPRQRPPFPAQSGLWGCPTVINNVETLADVSAIIRHGAQWFSTIGTQTSRGTKIFSLVGKINNTGLIEVPMGITLREIVDEIGGGVPRNKKFKAVQTGGPSGGCIPGSLIDLPIDYESLKQAGSMMGSGGMIVMDEDTCMVDMAKFFIQFTNDESCGKCTACRDGSGALLEVLTRISDGEGREGDLEFLEELSLAIKDASMCGLGQSLPNPVLSALRYFRAEFEAHVRHKRCPAVVCRGIISSPCQYSCPLETDVPAYVAMTAQGNYREALAIIRRTNPLPAVCGRVCMGHCETRCRAAESGDPIPVRQIKRFLSDWELRAGEVPPVVAFARRYEQKVAIVGSGPAGLVAAHHLSRTGYEVTVFEALPVAGGMLAAGIPEYRLPRKLLEMEIDTIVRSGVTIKTGCRVSDIDALFAQGYAAVLIAAGAHRNRRLGIAGEDGGGIVDPLALLRAVNLGQAIPSLGDRIGVIGGGNTAIDAARTAVRLGSREVTILYRRTRKEMPAAHADVEAASEEGVRIEFLVAPTRLMGTRGRLTVELTRMILGEPDATGRPRPVPVAGSEFTMELDTIIPAVSQDPDLSFVTPGCGIDTGRGTVGVDSETYMTGRPGVFACGDAVTGPGDVTSAMASGAIAAGFIHKFLRGEPLAREYRPTRPSVVVEPPQLSEVPADDATPIRGRMLGVFERQRSFSEVELGLTETEAVQEARRCLRCDWELQKRLRQKRAEAEGVQRMSAGV